MEFVVTIEADGTVSIEGPEGPGCEEEFTKIEAFFGRALSRQSKNRAQGVRRKEPQHA